MRKRVLAWSPVLNALLIFIVSACTQAASGGVISASPTAVPSPTFAYLDEARQCEAAFSASVEEGIPSTPALVLKKTLWNGKPWTQLTYDYFPPASNEQPFQTLVCILEDRQSSVDEYTLAIGVDPYHLIWNVRIVDLASGRVIGSGYIKGERPYSITETNQPDENGDLYGAQPVADLVHVAKPALGDVLFREQGVGDIAFSPDGRYLAAAEDSSLQILDWITRETVVDVIGISMYGWGGCLAFSPDGSRLATCSGPRVFQWDTGSGGELFQTRMDGVKYLFYSPDGTLLIGGGFDTFYIWDAVGGELLRTIDIPDYGYKHVSGSMSPDGETLAVGVWKTDQIIFFDPRSGEEIRPRVNVDPGYVEYSPDGRWLETGSWIYAAASMEPMTEIEDLYKCTFTPDSNHIVYQTLSGYELTLMNIAKGETITRFGDPGRMVQDFDISPDGKWLVVVISGEYVWFWDLTQYYP